MSKKNEGSLLSAYVGRSSSRPPLNFVELVRDLLDELGAPEVQNRQFQSTTRRPSSWIRPDEREFQTFIRYFDCHERVKAVSKTAAQKQISIAIDETLFDELQRRAETERISLGKAFAAIVGEAVSRPALSYQTEPSDTSETD